MANKQKATKNFKLSIKGVLDVNEDGRLIACIEDKGELDLAMMMKEFLGRECSVSVSYDEDYEEPEVKVNLATGEVIE